MEDWSSVGFVALVFALTWVVGYLNNRYDIEGLMEAVWSVIKEEVLVLFLGIVFVFGVLLLYVFGGALGR